MRRLALGALLIFMHASFAGAQGFGKNHGTVVETGQALPTLLELSEIPPRLNEKKPALVFGAPLTESIRKNYVFAADFEERDRPPLPGVWVDAKTQPLRALLLGRPNGFSAPKIELHLPQYRLQRLFRLEGSDDVTFLVNTAMSYWLKKDYQKASDAFSEFEEKAEALGVKQPSLAINAGWLLRGFFYVEMAANHAKLAGRRDPKFQEKEELPNNDLLFMARRSFFAGAGSLQIEKIFRNAERPDEEIFQGQFDCPVFEEDGMDVQIVCANMDLQRNLTPARALRSLVIAGFWNLVASERLHGQWGASFDAADEFERAIKMLPRGINEDLLSLYEKKEPLELPTRPTVGGAIRLWPRTLPDLVSATHLLRAIGMVKQDDPLEILRYADKAIRAAHAPSVAAAGFLMAGQTYFKLNAFRLAKQAFSWCEAVDESFSGRQPACVFLGAESAFWLGKHDIAQNAFNRFLQIAGDPEFGPWAEFRLGLIKQFKGQSLDAQVDYAKIARLYPNHKLFWDASVHDYCLQIADGSLEKENRALWSDRLNAEFSKMWDGLRLQGQTCMLWGDFQDASADVANKRATIAQDAEKQIKLFLAYKALYPESPYLVLFEDRVAKLNLAFVLDLADQNKCDALMDAYEINAKQLNSLGETGQGYLRDLVWRTNERRIVMRCSALRARLPLWEMLRKGELKDDGLKLQQALFKFRKKPGQNEAIAIAKLLDAAVGKEGWGTLAKEATRAGTGYVRDERFWTGLLADTILNFDLGKKTPARKALRSTLLRGALKNPPIILEHEMLCLWAVTEAEYFSAHDWDRIFAAQSSAKWLSEDKSCGGALSATLLTMAQKLPSPLRDKEILLPWLEKNGVKQQGGAWLAYAERVNRQKGARTAKVLYSRIAAEAEDPTLTRAVAINWLEMRRAEE